MGGEFDMNIKSIALIQMVGLVAVITFFGQSAATATTYTYTGLEYTHNPDPADFGTHMTGSVTFNFDTSGVSGTYDFSGGTITNLQLTSGIYTSAYIDSPAYFILVNGVITEWQVPTETGAAPDVLIYTHQISPFANVFDEAVRFGDIPDYALVSGGGGAWTVDATPAVPEPSTWAMMILGFAGVGFMAYRRKSKISLIAT
jgi:hypothetical protein